MLGDLVCKCSASVLGTAGPLFITFGRAGLMWPAGDASGSDTWNARHGPWDTFGGFAGRHMFGSNMLGLGHGAVNAGSIIGTFLRRLRKTQ